VKNKGRGRGTERACFLQFFMEKREKGEEDKERRGKGD
jgi:hypothetical protein